ncbi:unnamed protein product [Protopolystoma xenopodis]|uniref:Uncharacterized protein n=1 Tax=Protopolystoma xenopodis TaxID=117903 RepID=A0A448WMC0_9PLAT|nr:unnamed protein product [Protopolystoma xenopodis]
MRPAEQGPKCCSPVAHMRAVSRGTTAQGSGPKAQRRDPSELHARPFKATASIGSWSEWTTVSLSTHSFARPTYSTPPRSTFCQPALLYPILPRPARPGPAWTGLALKPERPESALTGTGSNGPLGLVDRRAGN